MVKQVSTKGFTLIEMIIVLSIITICLLVFPIFSHNKAIAFRYDIYTLKQRLLQAQIQAMEEKRMMDVSISGNGYQIGNDFYSFSKDTYCDIHTLHYTPLGSVSRGQTISCNNHALNTSLVIQLGSGQNDIR